MKKIRVLIENIRDELKDAEKYARLALENRDNDLELSDMYHDLAEQELRHASVEHDNVARIIREEKERGNEAPDAMMAVWDWEHRKALEDEIEIRTMIAKYLR